MQEFVVLISEKKSILAPKNKVFTSKYGKIDTAGVKIGDCITLKDEIFVVAEPSTPDLLKKCRRGAQIVMPKDAAQLVAITGLSRGWRCLDAGSGSGFMSLFLGIIVGRQGQVITYEKRADFFSIAKKNIELFKLDRVVAIKNQDVTEFRERNLDLIFFDFKDSSILIKKAKSRLKPGRWLVVYSPHIESQLSALAEMRDNKMHISATVETIQRFWKSNFGYTHPEPSGIMHTGFMTFARKVL